MRKIITAFLMAILVILVPISVNSVVLDLENSAILNKTTAETPCIYITNMERLELMGYIENNFDEKEKDEAYNLIDRIVTYDDENQVYEINMPILANMIENYSYYKVIPQEIIDNVESKAELNNIINNSWNFTDYPFANLIDKVIELIKERLGWIYEFFNRASILFIDGVDLIKDFINDIKSLEIAKLITTVVNVMVTIPVIYFSDAIRKLFNLDIQGFIAEISEFTNVFTQELSDLVSLAESVLENLGEEFQPLLLYVSDIGDFVNWINSEPWKNNIKIKGSGVNLLLSPYSDATITCRNNSDVTDSEGRFEFTVYPSDDSEDSIPSNSWYGLHLCVITISKDGETIKQTPEVLSYVFSGGTIEWTFLVPKSKSVDKERIFSVSNYFDNLIQNFQNLLLFSFETRKYLK